VAMFRKRKMGAISDAEARRWIQQNAD